MTLFTLIAALLVAVALGFLLTPLLRARPAGAAASRQEANASIYREQLEELAAERQRGAITPEEFERSSRELERRIVVEHAGNAVAAKAGTRVLPAVIAIALLVPLAAGLGYWQLGNPGAISGSALLEAGHAVTPAQMESLVERLRARMDQTPEDPEGWMLLGRSYAVMGQYERSAQAYARASKLSPNDAGLLADYADSLAMAQGRNLEGEPLALVKRALEIDPANIKALALAGSAEFERKNYEAAIAYWERIVKHAPPESEFARSVAGSIAEARSLSGKPAAKAPVAEKARAPRKDSSLKGVVSLDPGLAAKASPGDTVFVLARPASGSKMPLAVARTTVAQLPYRFTLDDSMAMAAGATISSQSKVVVAARISKSGAAAPQKGDLEGASAPVAPGAAGVKVVISRVVE